MRQANVQFLTSGTMKRLLFLVMAATLFIGFACQKDVNRPVVEAENSEVVTYTASDNVDFAEKKIAAELVKILDRSDGQLSIGQAHNAMLEVYAKARVRSIDEITRPAAQALVRYYLQQGVPVEKVEQMGITPENLEKGVMECMCLLGFVSNPADKLIKALEKDFGDDLEELRRLAKGGDLSSIMQSLRGLKFYQSLGSGERSDFEDVLKSSYSYWSSMSASNPYAKVRFGDEVKCFWEIIGALALVDALGAGRAYLNHHGWKECLVEAGCASAEAGLCMLLL